MKNCKAIIFDLGGVILNIDYSLTASAFQSLGIKESDNFYSKKIQHPIFDQLEIGSIAQEVFLLAIQEFCPKATMQEIKQAWNAMLLDLPQDRTDFIRQLKAHKKIFLLSNTNAIHITAFRNQIGAKRWKEFVSLFDKIYFSHEIKARKPNAAVFQMILAENNLQSKEVFFVDDSPQHIEAAKKLGINCHQLLDGEDIITILSDTIR